MDKFEILLLYIAETKEIDRKYLLKEMIQIRDNLQKRPKTNNIYKMDESDSGKTGRKCARNFLFEYQNVEKEEAELFLKNKFTQHQISSTIEGETVKISVLGKQKRSINSTKRYMLNGRNPIIRTFSISEVKTEKKEVDEKNMAINNLQGFLLLPDDINKKSVELYLKDVLIRMNVVYYSEYILSSTVFGLFCDVAALSNWNSMVLFSMDTKIEHFENKKLGNYRCDMVVIYGDALFVIEYKYIYMKKRDLGKEAIDYIVKKNYMEKVSSFIEKNYKDIYKKIKRQYMLGIGYSVSKENKIDVQISFKERQDSNTLSHTGKKRINN